MKKPTSSDTDDDDFLRPRGRQGRGGEEDDGDDDDERSRRFWNEEFATVPTPRALIADFDAVTTPLPSSNQSWVWSQVTANRELDFSLSLVSLSSASISDLSNLSQEGRDEASGEKTTTPKSVLSSSSRDYSISPFSPVAYHRRGEIGFLSVLSDASSSVGGGDGTPRPRPPPPPPQRQGSGNNNNEDEDDDGSQFSFVTQRRGEGGGQGESFIIATPLGSRRLVANTTSRRVRLVVDSSNKTLYSLRSASIFSFGLSRRGATRMMGSDTCVVEQLREGYRVTFESQPADEAGTPERRMVPSMENNKPGMAFQAWTDPENSKDEPIPLGAFHVKPAYFTGTYKGDLVEKRECGMMYSPNSAAVTVIQSNHPDFITQKSHFVIGMTVNNGKQTLFRVAIHKRLWAHSWARGKEDVYFPSVPVFSSSVGGMPADIGVRIFAKVYATSKADQAKKKKDKSPKATVVVIKVVFELPLSVSEFIVEPRATNRAIF